MSLIIRTFCFMLWNEQQLIVVIIGLVSGFWTIAAVVIKQYLKDNINNNIKAIIVGSGFFMLCVFVLFLATKWLAYFSEAVPDLRGKTYNEICEKLDEVKISANIEYRYEGEEEIIARRLEDGTVEGDIPKTKTVFKHIPDYKMAMPISGGTIILYISKEEFSDEEMLESTAKYDDVILLENYEKYEWQTEDIISFSYPKNLFTLQNSPNKGCPLFNAEKCIYLEGIEQGLYAWVSTASKPDSTSIEEIIQDYEKYYSKYFSKSDYVKEDLENVVIITGYRKNEVGYVIISVEKFSINTLYISFPYSGIWDKEEFPSELMSLYGDYGNYREKLEEDYRIKSYMVKVMYASCSFGYSSGKPEAYEEYYITWPYPSRKDMQQEYF